MIHQQPDVEESEEPVILVTKKKKEICRTTWFNHQAKKLNEQLELKLPNEFKGCISNYNHRSVGSEYQIDENDYSY